MKLTFCKSHIINHYFCDVLPLLNLSCSSTHLNVLLVFVTGGLNTLVPTVAVAVSCVFIFCSILLIGPQRDGPKLLNLQLSSHGCGDILWVCHLHVFQTSF
jgi:hypothetical protein